MNYNKIINSTQKPELYEQGTSQMWTDSYISRQLLDVHLNRDVDLASRKMSTIENTVDWILSKVDDKNLKILDLGCGPGLYTERLYKKGHQVTGVDFSEHSIAYAKKEAERKKFEIEYINKNYLNLNLQESSIDLVIMIFTDFGVLTPNERSKLLTVIKKVLKPNGVFIFDVLNDSNLESKLSPKNWEIENSGFWKEKPYLALSESFFYSNSKVILNQHMILSENETVDIYRFWIHFFSNAYLTGMMEGQGFSDIKFYDDVLPEGDLWSGNNVTFCKVINNK